MEKKTYWVLSIDGGGVRGLFSSMLLTKIEKSLGLDIQNMFDLIVGTSVGAMIGLSIAQGDCCSPYKNLVSLFKDKNIKRIFDKSYWDRIAPFQFKPKYDGKGKKEVIKEHIKIKTFGEVSTKTAVVVYNLTDDKTKIFKSWDEKDKQIDPFLIADSTSAAPTYFPCVKIGEKWYMDGGICANNPALIALQEAQLLWGKDADIRILSVGSGQDKSSNINGKSAQDWGAPEWIYNGLVDMFLDTPLDLMNDYCKNILSENSFLRINGTVGSENLDDTSDKYRKILEKSAGTVFDNKKEAIHLFFKNKLT